MIRSGSRLLPKLRGLLFKKDEANRLWTPVISSRDLHPRPDSFTQMETFMRDMEKKFWREVDQSFPWFPSLPLTRAASDAPSGKYPNYWRPSDVSTSDKFKVVFNFPNAKPEDIKVTLKERLLTIEAKVEESHEHTKINQVFNYESTIPEGVDVEALESVLSPGGILTIQAPRTPPEAPKTINIKRE